MLFFFDCLYFYLSDYVRILDFISICMVIVICIDKVSLRFEDGGMWGLVNKNG